MSQRSKIISVAAGEVGYVEGANNDTKYGTWYGLPNQEWCAMFVSWCANQAGIPTSIIPKFALCSSGISFFSKLSAYRQGHSYGGSYTAKAGDIVFFGTSQSNSTHTGIVEKTADNILYTIEGNTSDMVARRNYNLSSTYILGYGVPQYEEDDKGDNNSNDDNQAKYNEILYTISSGDTLYQIALKHGTTYQVIADYNKLTDPNKLSLGQVIKIPVKTYTVKSGDTLWSIAASQMGSGSRYTEIKALNQLKSDIIHPGQILKMP